MKTLKVMVGGLYEVDNETGSVQPVKSQDKYDIVNKAIAEYEKKHSLESRILCYIGMDAVPRNQIARAFINDFDAVTILDTVNRMTESGALESLVMVGAIHHYNPKA